MTTETLTIAQQIDAALPLAKDVIRPFESLARKDQDGVTLRSYADPASPLARAIQRKGMWNAYLKCHWHPPVSMDRMSGAPWTIGWGSTGPEIGPGTKWTYAKANDRFETRLRSDMAAVLKAIGAVPRAVTANELAAMTSLAYNIGVEAFRNSTLLRLYRAGDIAGAADQFPRWNKAQGQVMPGLDNRRAHERALFLGAPAA